MHIEVGIFAKKSSPRGSMTDIARAWDTEEYDERGGRLFLLADGSGRGNFAQIAGESAVYQTRQNFYEYIEQNPDEFIEDVLRRVLIKTNQQVYKQAKKAKAQGNMGASMIVAVLREDQLTIAWLGNARAYVLYADADQAQQATFDTHNEETGALLMMGNAADTSVGVYSLELDVGDIVILCSDGLYEALSADRFSQFIRQRSSIHMAAADMVNTAIDGGGQDNASVLMIHVHDGQTAFDEKKESYVSHTLVNELVTDLDLNLVSDDTETQEIHVASVFDDVQPEQERNEAGAILPFRYEDISELEFEFEDNNPFEFESNSNERLLEKAGTDYSFEDDQDEFIPIDEEGAALDLTTEPPITHEDTTQGEPTVAKTEDVSILGDDEASFDDFFSSIVQEEAASPDKALMAEEDILAFAADNTQSDDTFFDGDFDDLMQLEREKALPRQDASKKRSQVRQMNVAVMLFSGVLLLAAVLILGSSYLLGEINSDPVQQLPTIASIARNTDISTSTQSRVIVTGQADNPKSPTETRRPSPTAAERRVDVPNGWVNGTVLYITSRTGYRRDVFSPPLDESQFTPGDEVVVSLARQTVGYREWYEYNGERWWFVDNIGWLSERELSDSPPR